MRYITTKALTPLLALLPASAAYTAEADSSRVIIGEKTYVVTDSIAAILHSELARIQPSVGNLSRYERNSLRRARIWLRLIPSQSSLQFAGSIGVASIGPGWHYGKHEQWETDLLFGFVPKYDSDENVKFTITAKQRYIPWRLPLSSRWTVEPLTAGIFFNTITGEDFWANEPDRYPKKYYGFPTRIRTHLFLGQRLRYNIPSRYRRQHRNISFYYEISISELNLISKFGNSAVPLREALSLALGLRFEMF